MADAKVTVRKKRKSPDRVLEDTRLAAFVADLLQPAAGFIANEWEWDTEKCDRLGCIAKAAMAVPDDDRVGELIHTAQQAVIDLRIARNGTKARNVEAKLKQISEAAFAFGQAYREVRTDPSVRGAVQAYFTGASGVAPVNAERAPVERLGGADKADRQQARLRRRNLRERVEQFGSEDAWTLIGELGPLLQVLEACRVDLLHEKRCVWRLAAAWREATGRVPTATRNVDAATGRGHSTLFQDFIAEALPEKTAGSEIVRNVISAMKSANGKAVGVASTQNPAKRNPKIIAA